MKWPSLHDNSFADYYSLDFIDAVVFAGTPSGWDTSWIPSIRSFLHTRPHLLPGRRLSRGVGPPGHLFHLPGKGDPQACQGLRRAGQHLLEHVSQEIKAVHLPCPRASGLPRPKGQDIGEEDRVLPPGQGWGQPREPGAGGHLRVQPETPGNRGPGIRGGGRLPLDRGPDFPAAGAGGQVSFTVFLPTPGTISTSTTVTTWWSPPGSTARGLPPLWGFPASRSPTP